MKSQEKEMLNYHFFIAHSATDISKAIELYNLLTTRGMSVYLDAISMKPGDLWDEKLQESQSEALVTLVLISINTSNSFYQKEEVAIAIELSRQFNRLVIPIYLEPILDQKHIPYGLKRIQSLFVTENKDLLKISDELVDLIQSMQNEEIYDQKKYPLRSRKDKGVFWLENALEKKIDINLLRFIEKLEQIMDMAFINKLEASIVFFDVDGMTQINRYHGKMVADEVNSKIHEIFNNTIKGAMTTYKIGSDEYIAASLNCDQQNAVNYANKICSNINNYNWNEIKYDLRVTASFGVAQHIKDFQEFDYIDDTGSGTISFFEGVNEWIIRAIYGSRESKKKGGNQISIGPKYLPDHLVESLHAYLS
jgi:diguanylate cyclase (GGDEF)-like protein